MLKSWKRLHKNDTVEADGNNLTETQPQHKRLNIAICIPTYNERDNIDDLFSRIDAEVYDIPDADFTIFVVDDNSPDGTADYALNAANRIKNCSVEVMVKENKEGLGSAYIWGLQKIEAKNVFDSVIMMDADLSHDPKYLRKFVENALDGCDFVVATRYAKGGDTIMVTEA